MSLPKLNANMVYETQLVSTPITVKYRPFLVGEEKALMMAQGDNQSLDAQNAIINVINACVLEEGFDISNLSSADMEWMFLQIRAKSVGETQVLKHICPECGAENETAFDFEKSITPIPGSNGSPTIPLGDGISVNLKRLAVKDMTKIMHSTPIIEQNEVMMTMQVIEASIDEVLTADAAIKFSQEPKAERAEFVNSMTSTQIKTIAEWIEKGPRVEGALAYTCSSCDHMVSETLAGIQSFFG